MDLEPVPNKAEFSRCPICYREYETYNAFARMAQDIADDIDRRMVEILLRTLTPV